MITTSATLPIEELKPIFTLAGEPNTTITTDSYEWADTQSVYSNRDGFSSMLSGMERSEMLRMLSQQEPATADTAPTGKFNTAPDMEDMWPNDRMNRPDSSIDEGSVNSHYTGYHRMDADSSSGGWSDNVNVNTRTPRQTDLMASFDFLIKCLSSANNYVSMLTREQLSVLRSIRPSLLYELLQEIARARSERRVRRVLPTECAFCKNNGENEECYSKHALKDWRGRVLCPVLRAFHCPRCGATGDWAHTIKYCPQAVDIGASGLTSRRRVTPSTLLLLGEQAGSHRQGSIPVAPSTTPASPDNENLTYSALWAKFNGK